MIFYTGSSLQLNAHNISHDNMTILSENLSGWDSLISHIKEEGITCWENSKKNILNYWIFLKYFRLNTPSESLGLKYKKIMSSY